MADLTGFNADNHPDITTTREPLPPGTYLGLVTRTEQKTSQAGNDYLEVEVEITEGTHARRRIWDRLNLWHPNETASDIAKRRLASLCRAVGVKAPGDSSELHDKPLAVIVQASRRKDTGEKTHEVQGYASAASVETKPIKARTAGEVRNGVASALAGKGPKPALQVAGKQDDIPF